MSMRLERNNSFTMIFGCYNFSMKKPLARKVCVFTLVEMLIVISILLILISLLQPHLRSILGKGRQMACKKTEQSFGLANAIYANDYDGTFIPPWYYEPGSDRTDKLNRTAWFGNTAVKDTMQVTYLPGPVGNSGYYWDYKLICPDSHAATVGSQYPGYLLVNESYALNTTRLGLSGPNPSGYAYGNPNPNPTVGEDVFYSITQVKFPSQTLFLGESNLSPGVYRYDKAIWSNYIANILAPGARGGNGYMAFPHDWSVNTLFFDGSVNTMIFSEFENKAKSSLWRPDF